MRQHGTPSWWVDNLLRPALIAAMLTCLMAPPVALLEWLYEDWEGTYVLAFAFVAGLEGIISERTLQKQRITGWGYLVSRAAEFLVLMLALKLVGYVGLGFDQLRADSQLWSIDINTLVTEQDLYLAMLFLPMWAGAIYVARMVRDLDVQEMPSPPSDKTSIEYYLWLTRPSVPRDCQQVLQWLGEFFVWGGIVLLFMSMLVYLFVSQDKGVAWPVTLYFILGIALMSQGQFSVLTSSWQVQEIPVQRGIARRWLVWAAIFVTIVTLVAALLPTWYTMGPLQALLGLLAILADIFTGLLALLLYLLSVPLRLLVSEEELPPPPTMVPQSFSVPEAANHGSAIPEIIISAVFWTVVLAILTYSVYRFYRDRVGSLSDEALSTGWWGRIAAWLKDMWHRWRLWRQGIQERLVRPRAERKPERTRRPSPFRFFFPGRLPPREQVRYFYLSAEKRAGEAGRARRPGQTPYEYRVSLDESFPDLEPDLTGLTDAFVHARYSALPVQKEQAEAVKPLWQRIKTALRRRRLSEGQQEQADSDNL
jgi:hypothetical protein